MSERYSLVKSWHIKECGWERYFAEVAELSRGRDDVTIENPRAGVLELRERCAAPER